MSGEGEVRRPKGLTKSDWVDAARRLLVDKGIASVNLRSLSQSLGVTTGAFYWRFSNLHNLHEALRSDWSVRNTEPFIHAVQSAGTDGPRQYLAYVRVLILDEEYDPHYDAAIREWARSSPETAAVLHEVEHARTDLLRGVFEALGFEGKAAQFRALITYTSQAGYHTMDFRENIEERLAAVPYYAEILTQSSVLIANDGADAVRRILLETRTSENNTR